MPTRIEIELTSAGSDGSWTWRAAGAREPRGTLDGSILPDGASVGDQLKVEAEKDIDGIRVLSIVLPKQKDERGGVLELLPSGDFEPVIQQRATRDRHEGGDRGRPRRDRREQGDRGDREREPWVDKPYRPERPPGDDRTGAGERRGGPRRGEGGEGRRHQRPHFTPPPELPQRPKPKRLRPGKLRRAEVLAEIPEEQRPVAELALQGMAAVRQRLREDNARLKAEDKPEMPEATVLKMAENLLPQMRVADWLDRAEAAKRQLANLDLRDLRSVVAASDDPLVVRDEATRDLAVELKAALVTKQEEELNLWLGDVEAAVDVGRVVRALRLSAMPPKAGVPFPHELGTKLGEATTAALTADDPADRWIAVLEAAAFSPIRSQVTPSAAPAQPAAELVATVTRLAPLLPQVAALLGIEVPAKGPIPKPLRPAPRKKEAAKPAAAEPRGDIATHPGPKGDAKPKAEPKPVAEAAEASVAAVVEAPEPEVVEPDVASEAVIAEVADAVEPEVASEPEAAEAEVADAADASVAAVVEAPDAEVVEPEVASEPEVAEAEAEAEAEVADAVDVPEPEVVEAPEVEVVEPEVASEPDVAEAPESAAVDVPAADVVDALEAEVAESEVTSEPDAP
ncbi:MAG TPA: hypothetical protein VK630_10240 [Reyranella sp.]|nr:hypothetical protein [Reyranella sp.]